jgi:hypothetical protein
MDCFKVVHKSRDGRSQDWCLKKSWRKEPFEVIWREFLELIDNEEILNLVSVFGTLYYKSRAMTGIYKGASPGVKASILRKNEVDFLYKDLKDKLEKRR